MIIRYTDGTAVEAVLLARDGNSIRVAPRGGDDVVEFQDHNGTWVGEDCEPVSIEFEWQRHRAAPEVADEDCICPSELASRLIHLLYNSDETPAHAGPADQAAGRIWFQIRR